MTILKRRKQFQNGSLTLEHRECGPDVWVYRYLTTDGRGKKRRPKVIVGTIDQYPTEDDAWIAAEHLRLQANAECTQQPPCTIGGLVRLYVKQILEPCIDVELGCEQDETARMSFHCAKSYRSNLHKYVLARWETYLVEDFEQAATRMAMEDWLRSLMRSSKNPTGLAGKTVVGILNTIKQLFKFAVKRGYLAFNPAAEKRIELPRGSGRRSKRSAQLSPSEFFALLSLFQGMERVAICFAGWLGPRISEAFGLKWQDLDLDAGVVAFRRGFVQGRLSPLKTEASRTDLPMPDEVLDSLRQWRKQSAYSADSDWVFASPHRHDGLRPYWPAQLMKMHIQPVAVRAGFPKLGWHSFRHTFTAWTKETGLSLSQAKALTRHETDQVFHGYGELDLNAKRRFLEELAAHVRKEAAAKPLLRDADGKLMLQSGQRHRAEP